MSLTIVMATSAFGEVRMARLSIYQLRQEGSTTVLELRLPLLRYYHNYLTTGMDSHFGNSAFVNFGIDIAIL